VMTTRTALTTVATATASIIAATRSRLPNEGDRSRCPELVSLFPKPLPTFPGIRRSHQSREPDGSLFVSQSQQPGRRHVAAS
jgi:hypothetical protein